MRCLPISLDQYSSIVSRPQTPARQHLLCSEPLIDNKEGKEKECPISSLLQVRKHSALLHVQSLLALLPLRSNFNLNPVDALHQARLVHVRAQKAILVRFALGQANAVDGDEDLVRSAETQGLGHCG